MSLRKRIVYKNKFWWKIHFFFQNFEIFFIFRRTALLRPPKSASERKSSELVFEAFPKFGLKWRKNHKKKKITKKKSQFFFPILFFYQNHPRTYNEQGRSKNQEKRPSPLTRGHVSTTLLKEWQLDFFSVNSFIAYFECIC